MLKRTFSFILALFMVVFILPFSSMRSSAADENLLLYTYFDFSVYLGDKATDAPDKLEITSNKSNNGVISASLEVFSQENFMTDLDFWLPVNSGDELNNKLSYRVGVEIDVDKAGIRDYLKTYTKRADPTSNDPIQFYVVNPYDNSNIIQGTLEPLILMDNVKQLTIYFFLGRPQVKAAVDLSIELPFNIGTSMNKNDVKVTKNPNAFNSEFTVDNALLLYENDTESSLVSSSRHILSNNYNYTAYVTLKFDTEINILNECSASLYNTKTKTVMRKTDLSTQTMVSDISKSSDTSDGYIYYISFDIGSPIIPEIAITKDLPESIKLTGAAPSVTLSVDAFCNTGADITYKWYQQSSNAVTKGLSDIFYDVDDTAKEITIDCNKLKSGYTLPMEVYVSVSAPGLDTVFTKNCKIEYQRYSDLDASFLNNKSGDLYWNDLEGAAGYRVQVVNHSTQKVYTDMIYEAGQGSYHHVVYSNLTNAEDGSYPMDVILYAFDNNGQRMSQEFKADPYYTYPGKIVSGELIDSSPETVYFYPGDESAMFFVNVVGEENYTYSWVVSNQNGENWFEDESDVFYYHGMNNKYLTAKDDGSEVECDIFTGQTTLHSNWFKLKATRKGDVNLDGTVNVADMVNLQRYLLGANKNLNSWKAGDTCEDGKINVFDLVELRQIVAENAQ